jgi:hypothetical protein
MDLYIYYLYNNKIKFEHNLDNIRSELKVSYVIIIALNKSLDGNLEIISRYREIFSRTLTTNMFDYSYNSSDDFLLDIDGYTSRYLGYKTYKCVILSRNDMVENRRYHAVYVFDCIDRQSI